MKKVSQKIRKGIIDRFFMAANELPHSISYSHKESGWMVFNCISANHTIQIAHKDLWNQFIKWS